MVTRGPAALDLLATRLYNPGAGVDTFGPPLDDAATRALLAAVRGARFADGPPFTSPLADGVAGNDVVHARIVAEPRADRWAVLVGWYGSVARDGALGWAALHARALEREGLGVVVMPLPFHGPRGLPDVPSGYGAVRADLARSCRTLAQAAADAAALARWLRESRGASFVGGYGCSLGGNAVGLAAALAPDAFDALALHAAADNPVSFYFTGLSRAFRRVELARHGYGREEVARAFAPFAPSSYPAPVPGARIAFAIPGLDGTIPPAAQHAWRRAWGGRRVAALLGAGVGHAAGIVHPLLVRAMARALARA